MTATRLSNYCGLHPDAIVELLFEQIKRDVGQLSSHNDDEEAQGEGVVKSAKRRVQQQCVGCGRCQPQPRLGFSLNPTSISTRPQSQHPTPPQPQRRRGMIMILLTQ